MAIRKTILIVSKEEFVLDMLQSQLGRSEFYCIHIRQDRSELDKLLPEIPNLARLAPKECYDLILLVGYDLGSPREFADCVKRTFTALQGLSTVVVFSSRVSKRPSSYHHKAIPECGFLPFDQLSDPSALRVTVDRALGAFDESCEHRERIADSYVPGTATPQLPPSVTAALAHFRAAHFFGPDEHLRHTHVPYTPDNVHTLEEESDRRLDSEYRHIESTDHFHKIISTGECRTTHLLLGHRGCGKTSFLHHYTRCYRPFLDSHTPYVIVDFLNYGFTRDDVALETEIIAHFWEYLTENKIKSLLKEYPTRSDLFPLDAILIVAGELESHGIQLSKLVNEDLQYRVERSLKEVGILHVGRAILKDQDAPYREASEAYRACLKTRPWEWMRQVWEYINGDSTGKPFRFFSEWILRRCGAQDCVTGIIGGILD
jgi:hypothetical protein